MNEITLVCALADGTDRQRCIADLRIGIRAHLLAGTTVRIIDENGEEIVSTTELTPELAAMPIDNLGMPLYAAGSLTRSGLRTVGDIMARTPADLRKVPNFAYTKAVLLAKALTQIGLEIPGLVEYFDQHKHDYKPPPNS